MEFTSIDVCPPPGRFATLIDAILSVWTAPNVPGNHDEGNFVVMHEPYCKVMEPADCTCRPTLIAPRQSRLVA